ncbi:MAG: glycosyltransferase family 4 protein [Candidatus Omnitrophica bacterium]|nr:glycosyltransferase family 4 protein [Candidatus Omnitrophota bacterium]
MRILIFTVDFPPIPGGISTYAYGITAQLNELGEEVIVLAQKHKESLEFDSRQKFKIVRVSNILFLREVQFFFKFIYLVRKHRIQHVLNIVWFPCAAISYFTSFLFGFSYSVVAFGAEIFDATSLLKRTIKQHLRWLARLVFNKAVKCFPISEFTKRFLEARQVKSEHLLVIPGGVDIEKFGVNADCRDIIDRYKLTGKKVILTVARLDDHKGHDVVIKALSYLLKKMADVKYLIVGDGRERKNLEELVSRLKLEDNVIFVGHVAHEDTPPYFSLCDVFVMPSRETQGRRHWFEGFGIAYLEANACAKPVIGGLSGGVVDAVIDQETGLLVDPYDAKKLSDLIYELLTNKEHAVRLGKNGKERVEKYFSWRALAERIRTAIKP